MEYLAHLDKEEGYKQSLREHLSSVANLASEGISPNVCFKDITYPFIEELVIWLGYFHDLGKYTDYFQNYLIEGIESNLKNHAHISACFTYNFLKDNLPKASDEKIKRIINFLVYLCIRKHHGSLSVDQATLFSHERERERWETLKKISINLLKKADDILEDSLLVEKIAKDKFIEYLDMVSLEKNKKSLERVPMLFYSGRVKDDRWYFFLIYIFSLLIDLDKLDSAQVKINSTKNIKSERVVEYLKEKHGDVKKTNLVDRREKARKTMLGVVDSLTEEEIKSKHFFTLTAPTGIGKTLASLQSALRLQERIKEVEGYTPRIITAIPFINIIEQTQKDYEEVLGKNIKLVTHHRLADFSSRGNTKETSLDKSLLEVESWEGDVILTTFVQLFQSLFTGRNKLLKKINKIAGSIVILDEVQAIPQEYMPVISAVLQKIAEYYGTRFILMTATQPKLLEFGNKLLKEKEEVKDIKLLPNYKDYFQGLKRTKFIPLLDEKLTTDGLIDLVEDKRGEKDSALIVVNTIKRSIDIYEKLKERLNLEKNEVSLKYLSTNIIPLDRRKVIKEVKEKLKNKEPVILVSTQTIEAGVDVDFDLAFRDFAPLDSLIQTAGRVNREGKKGEFLPIYIVRLEKDNNYVYGLEYRKATTEVLAKYEEILEPDYGKLADEYYKIALDREVSDKSKNIWNEGILKLKFEQIEEFRLINNLEEVADVFVEDGSERATLIADTYEEVFKLKDQELVPEDLNQKLESLNLERINTKINMFTKKALLRLIMAKLNDYIIQVRVSKLNNNKPIEFKLRGDAPSHLYWIPPGQLNEYYDTETGFIAENDDAYLM